LGNTTATAASSESKPEQSHKRQYRSASERRRIVERSLAPGANMKRVAEENGVRTNQLYKWRRQYRAGRLGPLAPEPVMLPVRIKRPTKGRRRQVKHSEPAATPKELSGTIRIELSGCWIIVDGIVDPNILGAILERLAK
jgi:transposase